MVIKRTFQLIYLLLIVCLTAVLVTCNGRLYTAVDTRVARGTAPDDVVAQLHFLRGELDSGAAEEMQRLFPEGYFFMYVLYGLTWVDVGLRAEPQTPVQQEAIAEAKWAFQRIDSPAGRAVFPAALEPPYGMFYNGWSSYLLAGILLLEGDTAAPADLQQFTERCEQIAQALQRSETPFLPSYTGQAWPVDSYPALVALRAHGQLVDGRYEPLIAAWLVQTQTLLDPQTGLVPHRTHYQTGALQEGARATSQTLILRFLADIDPAMAQEQYARFRQQFVVTRLGLPGIKEYPIGVERPGDIDSGPLLLGVSLSATAVGLGTARVVKDEALLRPLWQGGEALGMPLTWPPLGQRKKFYAAGLLPVGDAFLAWSKVARPWLTEVPSPEYTAVRPWWWRWPYHLLTLTLLAGLWWPLRRIFMQRK